MCLVLLALSAVSCNCWSSSEESVDGADDFRMHMLDASCDSVMLADIGGVA